MAGVLILIHFLKRKIHQWMEVIQIKNRQFLSKSTYK